jgi:hypothetical protein
VRYIPAFGSYLERYVVADGAGTLIIANENGDIAAHVDRSDGTWGTCYGGPVYEPPEFTNVCERVWDWLPPFDCDHRLDMTPAERAVADVLARRVGWMP